MTGHGSLKTFATGCKKVLRTTDTRKINYSHSPTAHSWEEEELSKNSLRHQTLPLNFNLIQSKTLDPQTTHGSWKRTLSSTPSYISNNRNKIKNDWYEVSMSYMMLCCCFGFRPALQVYQMDLCSSSLTQGLADWLVWQPVHHFSAHKNIFTKGGLITVSDIFNCDYLRAHYIPLQLEPALSDRCTGKPIKFVWTKKMFFSTLNVNVSEG